MTLRFQVGVANMIVVGNIGGKEEEGVRIKSSYEEFGGMGSLKQG